MFYKSTAVTIEQLDMVVLYDYIGNHIHSEIRTWLDWVKPGKCLRCQHSASPTIIG